MGDHVDNTEIITLLNEFASIADIMGEQYKHNAYSNAVQSIIGLEWTVRNNIDRVRKEKIPRIGVGIKARLIEYALHGRIADLDRLRKDKKVTAAQILSKIAGVGPVTVKDWLRMRVYDLAQLRRKVGKGTIVLNRMQQYGLKYYDDLNTRVPRDDVAAIGQRIKHTLISLQPDIQVAIAGSYRRGALSSGDIDIIASGVQYNDTLLRNLVAVLESDPNYVDIMSIGRERLTFLYRYDIVRQVDLLYLPSEYFYTGVLYFTGDWGFNEAMRGYARKKGYRLNQRGLYQLKTMKLIPIRSEKEIFDILGLTYVEPANRNALQFAAISHNLN